MHLQINAKNKHLSFTFVLLCRWPSDTAADLLCIGLDSTTADLHMCVGQVRGLGQDLDDGQNRSRILKPVDSHAGMGVRVSFDEGSECSESSDPNSQCCFAL